MIYLSCEKTGEPIELQPKIAKGGEAEIYTTNKDACLAKIYTTISPEQIEKLRFMVNHPPVDPTLTKGHISIAWPQDLLIDSQGKCVGFLMPAIKGSRTLINVYNSATRKKKAPGFNWLYLHTTALNITSILQALHTKNYVVGDLKTDNLLVNSEALVSIIDTDSFQVIDQHTGKIYHCPVASPEYTPQEMFDKDLQTTNRFEEQDCFSLAIIIWLLLFGYHPFSGKWEGSDEQPNIDQLIRNGHWMYGSNSKLSPVKSSIPIDILHPDLQDCFYQCFNDGHSNYAARPSVADWKKTLTVAIKDLTDCAVEKNHKYAQSYGKCYWCERKQQLNHDVFARLGEPEPIIEPEPIFENEPIPQPESNSSI